MLSNMYIVGSQSARLNHSAYFESQGTNIQDDELFVDDSSIESFSKDREKKSQTLTSQQKRHTTYKYTFDHTENSNENYQNTTRTCKLAGFARNPIFALHASLMQLIPAVLASIDPELYQQAEEHLMDMNYADYFQITAYPTYGGYKIKHDLIVTACCHLMTNQPLPEEPTPSGGTGVLIVVGALVIIIIDTI